MAKDVSTLKEITFVNSIWVHFIPMLVIPEIGVCGGALRPPAHPYFRNFPARLKHTSITRRFHEDRQ